MITEVFVLDGEKNLLVGNPRLLPPRITDPTMVVGKEEYFTHIRSGDRYYVGALYKSMNPVQVVRFLEQIDLNGCDVKNEYFRVLRRINDRVDDMFVRHNGGSEIIPFENTPGSSDARRRDGAPSDVYINQDERVDAVLNGSETIRATSFGMIQCAPGAYRVTLEGRNTEWIGRNACKDGVVTTDGVGRVVVQYVTDGITPPVFVTSDDLREYRVRVARNLSSLVVFIPVPLSTYELKCVSDFGRSRWDESKSMVIHEAKNVGSCESVVRVDAKWLEDDTAARPVRVEFKCDGAVSGVHIKAFAGIRSDVRAYVKERSTSGSYEVRLV